MARSGTTRGMEGVESVVRQYYRRQFGAVPARTACAPGTLELLGSHAEEHEGLVLLAAFDRYASVAASPRSDGRIELVRAGDPHVERFWLTDLANRPPGSWVGLFKSVLALLRRKRVHFSGFQAAVVDAVPAGLRAGHWEALAVAMVLAVRELFPFSLAELGADLPPRRDEHGRLPRLTLKECQLLARWCAEGPAEGDGLRLAHSRLLGTLLSRAWHVTSVDCRFKTVDWTPLVGEALVLCDPGIPEDGLLPGLERLREEWRGATAVLRARSLRSVEMRYLRAHRSRLTERQHACASHVVGEIQRVVYAERALREEDHRQVGHYLLGSHESARDQLGNSCRELDLLVELARRHRGCLGARMMGDGFGGATINLVAYHEVVDFAEQLAAAYWERTGRPVQVLVVQPVDGAGAVRIC